jgi:hypothetical protein
METYIENKDGLKTHLLYEGEMCKLHHPKGWREVEYSTYLGPFTDSNGHNYDLGVYKRVRIFDSGTKYVQISDAIVYADEAPFYSSDNAKSLWEDVTGLEIRHLPKKYNSVEEYYKSHESSWECYQRALKAGIFDDIESIEKPWKSFEQQREENKLRIEEMKTWE